MHAWEAIQNSLDYIEEHLSDNMEMKTLANVAALSPYYNIRRAYRLPAVVGRFSRNHWHDPYRDRKHGCHARAGTSLTGIFGIPSKR